MDILKFSQFIILLLTLTVVYLMARTLREIINKRKAFKEKKMVKEWEDVERLKDSIKRQLKKLLIIFLLVIFFQPGYVYALPKKQNRSLTVTAAVGEYRFSLFGYTSSHALVTIEGMGVWDQVTADSRGYFEFTNRFSPTSPREACLTARDQLGRISTPVCLPPFPIKYDVTIGPILLPPTISLNKNDYWMGNEIILSGQTIPESEVSFSAFIDEKRSIVNYISLIKPVYAYTFPQLTTKSDDRGNFSLSLPSVSPQFFRLFAQTDYQTFLSPESVTLSLKVLPIWVIIIRFLLFILLLFLSHLLEIIILGEIIIIAIYFWRRYTHPHVIARNRALALRELYPIVEEETSLMKVNY